MKFLSNILVKAGLVVEGSTQLNSLAGVGTRMVVTNAAGVMSTQPITSGTVAGSAAAGQVTFWTGASTVGGSNNLFWNNSTSMLGIGIATPLHTLDVAGSTRLNGLLAVSPSSFSQAGAESSLHIGRPMSAQTSYGATIRYEAQSGVVATHGLNILLSTQDAAFTISNIFGVTIFGTLKGASNTITNQYGVFVNSAFVGATNNYAYYSDIPAAANRWNLYMNGTANNYFAGRLLIGSNIDDNVNTLQVTGSIIATVNSTINGVSVGRGAGNIATNTALGASALITNSTGAQNTAVGNEALRLNTTGTQNSAFGYRASRGNTTGNTNSAFGIDALRVNSAGIDNAAFGAQALDNTTSNNNTAIGRGALLDNTSGGSNTALGYRAGYAGGAIANSTGSNNIFIGADSIGEAATDSNRTFLGNTSTTSTWLGGRLLIGSRVSNAAYGFRNSRNITGASISISNGAEGQIQTDASVAAYYYRTISSQIVGSVVPTIIHYGATQGTLSGISNNQYGFHVDSTLIGSTANYGFYGNIPSATGRWNLYMNGTAANYINGNLLIGSSTDTTEKLQVTGTMKVTGASTFSSTVTAASFIRSGGTSSQFLKADGSVDSATYLSSLTGEATNVGSAVTLVNSAVIGKVLTGLNVTSGAVTATDSILTALGKVQGQINSLQGGTVYKGSWNASTNTPTITSSVGVNGNYYVVTTAGTTTINGISSWAVGDWIIFNGTVWEKIPNIDSVVSVNGQTGAVSLSTTNIAEGANLYYTDARSRAAISLTTTGSSGVSTYVSGVLNIPNYTIAGLGGVPTSRVLTINGTSLDLSANRSWSIPAVTSVSVTVPTGLAVSGNPITTDGTIAISLDTGYSIPTIALQDNWSTAYNNTIVSAEVTGTTTKTLTLTQQDSGTITASWVDANTDAVTSVFGRTGAIVASNGDYTTSQVTEGGANLYYTDARARAAISVAGSGSYNPSTGVITINGSVTSVNGLSGAVTLTTSNIAEGTNLYYTDVRARAAISLTTTGSSGAASYASGVLNIPNYTLVGLNGVPTSRVLTINGTALDLSANRSFSVGTITGSGSAGYVPKLTTASNVANSIIYDNGTSVIVNSNTLVAGYSHSLQVLANAAGGMVISTTNSASAIGIINSSASNKTWDISPNNNDIAINESGVVNGTRMYLAAGGNVLVGSIIDDNTNKLQVNGTIKSTGITVTGSVFAAAYYESSDITRKNVLAVNPTVSLDVDVVKFTRVGDNDVRYGYSAQQIRDVAPELVSNGASLGVKYIDVHTLKIAALENEVRELKNKLNAVG